MSAEALFLSEIAKLKLRVIVRSVHRILLRAALIFLIICTILLTIEKLGFSKFGESVSFYVISVGAALFAALLISFVRRKNFLNVLIDIDTRFKLQDRISTAYEYVKFRKKSDFSDLLIQDAATKLIQLSTKQLFPLKFSFLHLVLLLLILINAALYSSEYLLLGYKSKRADPNKAEKVSTLLRNYTISRPEIKKTEKASQASEYSKKLEHLAKQLDNRSITQDQLFTSLNQFLEEIQAEQTRLAHELDAKLKAARIEEMPILKVPKLENLSVDKLEKFKMLLNRALSNQIPDSIDQNIETLHELHSLEKFLSQIIDDFDESKSFPEEFAEPQGNQTHGSQYTNDLEKAHDDPKSSKNYEEFLSRKKGGTDTAGRAGSDRSQANGRDLEDELGLQQGHSSLAGRAKSTGQKKASDEIEKSPGPGIQDNMMSSQAKNYLVHIRSLTDIGESKLKEEDIIRTYRQEIESILQKEDIPLNYREYIKQYFISIGLETADSSQK
ncbi:MAG: hypothetical protein JSV31_06650 [Desulfobacterales bacterium]|nr:MAG: hypothetical protein JSV31_06650 [Desulfobacterales bacterium]